MQINLFFMTLFSYLRDEFGLTTLQFMQLLSTQVPTGLPEVEGLSAGMVEW